MSFAPGDVVGGRYELGRQLGAGGMARVYLGHDRLLDRQVAIKVLSEPYASDPQFVERFRREASAAAGLNHPNIVAVYDRGEADGSYYIVMEYLSGPDLKQVIRSRAPLPAVEAIDMTQQLLAALGAAHRRDLVHRDVKPQNVLVAEDGRLKVTDFGIARAGAEAEFTEPGSVIGTAQYLSPEQARGGEVTAASDCYAAGIVLYELLTGRVPFDGGPPVAIAMKQVSDPPTPPSAHHDVPPQLEAVVMKALAKRPSERYRTAEEMSRALAEARSAIDGSGSTTRVMPAAAAAGSAEYTRVMEPATGPTRVAPPPPPAEPPRRRRRWPMILGILVILAAIATGAILFMTGDQADTVTVPRVAGQTEAEAVRALEGAGLVADVRTVESGTVPEGTVVGTDPPAGEEVDEGSTVVVRVSGGPGEVAVPDVLEMTEADATRALRQAGFEVRSRTEASDDVEEGLVISQDPAAEAQAAEGSTVTIVVSSGPEEVAVPDVRRRAQQDAEALLRDRDLEVRVEQRPSTDFAPGIVIDQDPGPTARVPKGSTVTIVVAVAPANVPVPDVTGNTATDARAKLQDAGFVVTSEEAPSDAPAGDVIGQNPSAGTQVAPGTRIVITVSSGPAQAPEPSTPTAPAGAVPAPPPSGADGSGADGRGPDGLGPPGQRR
ncbi:Stk1 family PASTA domain-containing Ser/Thr kinase [Miltoncostaea marina]|uniref:Stk1 family PASTA domain-containing Ser/Thr kinase n=1 Tax=Miltoncostaea marina TaxID=2843215 RepID=UPI001C3DC6CD|nr:Stk1 family PASTA domain-containing Ser/Thr kinase [Miltoncostaea marina]